MKRLALLAVLAMGSGCGGGGGSSLPLNIQFTPSSFSATYTSRGTDAAFFAATVTGTVSVAVIYVLVSDNLETFQPTSFSFTQTSANTYQANISKAAPLPTGVRRGTLTLRICGDLHCSQLLGRGTLPYTVTIIDDPAPVLETVNPVDGPYLAGGPVTVLAEVGGFVPPEQTLYARIEDASGLITGSAGPVVMQRQSDTDFAATFAIDAAATEGRHGGTLDVEICEDAGCTDVLGARQLAYAVDIGILLAGVPGTAGVTDGPGATATFSQPEDLVMDAADNVYVVERNGTKLRKIDVDGVVSSIATIGGNPNGIALAGDGSFFVTDATGCVIRRVNADLSVDTVAGSSGSCNATDGLRFAAGLALDSNGSGYVVDGSGDVVRQFVAGTTATPIYAGAYDQPGTADGAAADARFSSPTDIARDGTGNLYVADHSNHVIRKITPAGQVSTLAGGQFTPLAFPSRLDVAADGTLYIGAQGAVQKISPAGELETMFYGLTLPGGDPFFPAGVALSADGQRIVVADRNHHVIVRYTLP
jgi:sugar lactone lactonase YvrE